MSIVRIVGVLAAAAAVWGALYANSYYVFIIATAAITAIAGIGLNVLIGLTGQVSFGHVGFYAIGAYTVAILTVTAKVSFWIALPIAAVLAGALGMLLALPALRVRGPYLAMVTIAFGFVVEHVTVEWRGLTGGQNGVMGVEAPAFFGMPLGERGIAILAIVIVVAAVFGFSRLARSSWGLAMRAVCDSEVAAASVGLNPVVAKTFAFAISAALGGIAGGLFAPLSGFVTPSTFSFMQSILFVLVVIVGGAGTVSGPIVGAALVVLLPELLAGLAEYRLLFFGVLLMVVLWVAPRGIVGAFDRWRKQADASASESTATTEIAAPAPRPLDATGLSIAFGGIRAATGVSFAAKPGQVVSLIGPNGAGKTTVLNLLSGFYRPDAGAVQIGSSDVAGSAPHVIARAGITRTYQTSQLFASLTVEENLRVAQLVGRLGRGPFTRLPRADDAAARRAAELARYVGYRGRLDRLASALPHVDRRLVEIARALATGASVLLLDEPAAGLSAEDKTKLAALMRQLADRGYTVVLVEHAMSIVMSISDAIVVLDAGAPIAAGDPATVQRDPAVRRAYLGESAGAHDRSKAVPREHAPQHGRPLLETIGLGAGYGAEPVLKSLAVEVRAGETVAVLGANGAGKSTLMRTLAGLHRPVQGQIVFSGTQIGTLPAHRVAARGLVLVPEGRQVFPELSVRDNIRLGAFLQRSVTADEVEAMLDRFPRLRERLDQRAGLLSGGEQQMLAIARGLMAKPKTLLLDEPSLGLAPRIIDELFGVLDRLRNEGATILLVDQIAHLALAIADRGYVIESGRVVASGSAAKLASDSTLEQAYLGTS